MTPAELAEAVRAAVRAAVDSGQLPLPVEAIPTEVKVERPKVKEHGDYATSIALVARQASRYATARGRRGDRPPAGRGSPASDASTSPVRASSTSSSRRRRKASWPATIVDGGPLLRHGRHPGGRAHQPRVRLGQPHRPGDMGSARWAAVGDSLARILQSQGASVEPRVLLQRPRLADRPLRAVPAGPRRRASRCPRTATSGPTSTTSPLKSSPRRPGRADAAGRRGAGGRSGREGVNLMFAEIKSTLHDFGVDFDVVLPRERPARVAVPSSAPSNGSARSAGSTSRTAPSGCGRPTSATTATG